MEIFLIVPWEESMEGGAKVFLQHLWGGERVTSMLHTHHTIVHAQTSCKDTGNHSRFLMKNTDLPEVNRLQGIRNSLIYMMQWGILYYVALSGFRGMLINIVHITAGLSKQSFCFLSKPWDSKTSFLYLFYADVNRETAGVTPVAPLIGVWFLQHKRTPV